MKSKVEINKTKVEVGIELIYSDVCNYMTYLVTDVDDQSFVCVNQETKTEEVYFFDELQVGWDFKDNDYNKLILKIA